MENVSRYTPEEAWTEAKKFNQLHNENKVSGEYLSVLLPDQSPENVQEIIQNAEKQLQDINSFGVLAHGSRGLDKEEFKSILGEGLKSLNQLSEEGKNMGKMFALYPDSISFEMSGVFPFGSNEFKGNSASQFGVEGPSSYESKDDYLNRDKREYKTITCSFIANPEYIRQKISKSAQGHKREILIVGPMIALDNHQVNEGAHTYGSAHKALIELSNRNGWGEAAKPFKDKYQDDILQALSWQNHEAFYGEIVLLPEESDGTIKEPMLNGMVIEPAYSTQVISWLNEIVTDDPSKAVPLYDIYGNLIWPKQMSYEEVKQLVAERDKDNQIENKPEDSSGSQ